MSRFAVNKFMRLVNMDPGSLVAYKADPEGFVRQWAGRARWEEGGDDLRRAPEGGDLTEAELRALGERDFAWLYAEGAHPYLLWSFTEAVWTPELARADLVERFRDAAATIGYPDPHTTPAVPA